MRASRGARARAAPRAKKLHSSRKRQTRRPRARAVTLTHLCMGVPRAGRRSRRRAGPGPCRPGDVPQEPCLRPLSRFDSQAGRLSAGTRALAQGRARLRRAAARASPGSPSAVYRSPGVGAVSSAGEGARAGHPPGRARARGCCGRWGSESLGSARRRSGCGGRTRHARVGVSRDTGTIPKQISRHAPPFSRGSRRLSLRWLATWGLRARRPPAAQTPWEGAQSRL